MSFKFAEFWELSHHELEQELGKLHGDYGMRFCLDQLPDALLPDFSTLSVQVTLTIDLRRSLTKDYWWDLARSADGEVLHVSKPVTDSFLRIIAYVTCLGGFLTGDFSCRDRTPTANYACVPKTIKLSLSVTDESGQSYEWLMLEKNLFEDRIFWMEENRETKLKALKESHGRPGRYSVVLD